jgi:hypothetical protein
LIFLNQQTLALSERVARLPFLIINLHLDMKSDPMMTVNISDDLIEEFLTNVEPGLSGLREQYLLRETMYSLMRLMRSEQLLAIRQSVNRLVPASLQAQPVRRTRSKRFIAAGQHKLAFGKQA